MAEERGGLQVFMKRVSPNLTVEALHYTPRGTTDQSDESMNVVIIDAFGKLTRQSPDVCVTVRGSGIQSDSCSVSHRLPMAVMWEGA